MPKISVIVPVYNVEKYLRQCIDSILAQTFADFELILVDDGSPDKCGAICDEYAAEYPFVHVIHKFNGGLSSARNAGIAWILKNSDSQYVTFVDSDDWISPEYLLLLYTVLQGNNADISIAGLRSFDDGESVVFDSTESPSCNYMSGREACIHYYQMEWTIPIAACAKLYKINLFANIRFPEGKVYEDQGTVPKLWYTADRIAFLKDTTLYAYRIVPNSISHSRYSSRKFDDVWNVQACHRFFSLKKDSELAALSSRFRDILLAKYIVLAHHHDAVDQIPDEYQMSLWKALRLLRREINDRTYSWYLSLVHPKWVRPHSYIRKAEELLGLAKTHQ